MNCHEDLPTRGALTTLKKLRQTQFGRQAQRHEEILIYLINFRFFISCAIFTAA
jgi:hypothetical protein